MRRPTSKGMEVAIMVADAVCAAVALLFAVRVRYGLSESGLKLLLREGLPVLAGTTVFWLAVSDRLGLNRIYRSPADLISRAILACTFLSMGVAALAFFTKVPFSRESMAYFVAFFFVTALGSRLLLRASMCRNWIPGARRSAVVIGSGPVAKELITKIDDDPALMCQVIGCVTPDSQELGASTFDSAQQEMISTVSLAAYLAEKHVEQAFIVLPNSGDPEVQRLVGECRDVGIDVAFVPHAYELYVSRAVTLDVGGIPLISIQRRTFSPHSRITKALADYVTGLALLVITAPLMAVTALVLRGKHGRAFRRELRCGEGGKPFWMYRFNVNRFGDGLNMCEQFAVRTSLSELPQMFNVLRGEMSIVGPRPEPPDRVKHYSEWEKQRLFYKPGITGIAQVRGLREQHSSAEKARYDLQYPLSWSPVLDLTLIVQTGLTIIQRAFEVVKTVVENKGAAVSPIPRSDHIAVGASAVNVPTPAAIAAAHTLASEHQPGRM